MKTFLLYRERDFDFDRALPPGSDDVIEDLELETVFGAMARGDAFFFDTAKNVLLSGARNDAATIIYRQHVLEDCLRHGAAVRDVYTLCLEAIERERKNHFGIFGRTPGTILHRSIEVMAMFVEVLGKLRRVAHANADNFKSEGLTTFVAMLEREFSDDYFSEIETHLEQLKFRGGVAMRAVLGAGGKGEDYTLRAPVKDSRNWFRRVFSPAPSGYTITLHPRDDAGARALDELRDRGINQAANALAQSNDRILSFLQMLKAELAFYLGCVNLHETLSEIAGPAVFPEPVEAVGSRWNCAELYDVSLALRMGEKVVGNTVNADGKRLVVVTGANRGGKSTFLRSVGTAQLMMQAGMFVAGEKFCASPCDGLFTHYKREEDRTMTSGKFDEELVRMSDLAEAVTPRSMVLFNESFAATNEREGSEVARQIVAALLENGCRVFFVTHMYELAHGYYEKAPEDTVFLRAYREEDGSRSFRLKLGEPLQTSYGEDLYRTIFSTAAPEGGSGDVVNL
ncbi:MutS-related protein [Varunaivibrio sulfuroxidans]|uniref:MutS-like protein n=1 Tax=Varunaivibrio sulfuroxidans TaxID=1773489 RepID=A0A4R3JBQ6_9PROT|nr:DNA mismatch repair protein MutS [Varunaivibrio sulfuroxidans]TCS63074.1 MutS-like protein [Varunaivibrio sulfuroxidans]WES31854.1 DNA mismatch repair protein MutS [Varunaivibrio sulfuroxidans]